MRELLGEILESEPVDPSQAVVLGHSREGRPVVGVRLGRGRTRISLLADCHADEPVGPRLLHRLAGFLLRLPQEDPLVRDREWWIVPHANPDGAERNRRWQNGRPQAYDVADYLEGVVRELPGDDMEFGFPRGPDDDQARPENRSIHGWWESASGPFSLHASLHGMAFSGGPWFLLEPAWVERTLLLRRHLRRRVRAMGYRLHDVERHGEKGFVRIERGFATRPDSAAMRSHFLVLDDPGTATRFRPSSMEAIRGFGGDPLTMVSEMPLFITPGVGDTPGPPDPLAEAWKARIERWRTMLDDDAAGRVRTEAEEAGLRPMPVRDQMALQWAFISEGLALVEGRR